MTSHVRILRMIAAIATVAGFWVLAPLNVWADSSAASTEGASPLHEYVKELQGRPCPGCDADVIPGICGSELPSDRTGTAIKFPYGVTTPAYRDLSSINRANRAIGQSRRNLYDSIRRMNDSINKIRTLNRRF